MSVSRKWDLDWDLALEAFFGLCRDYQFLLSPLWFWYALFGVFGAEVGLWSCPSTFVLVL